jgi:hypothetical protein
MRNPFVVTSLLLASQLGAQVMVEDFSSNTLPPAWQVRSGTWTFQNGQATQTAGVWGYLTLQGISLYNCVVECDVYWGTTAAVKFGGVAARHPGTAADDACMVKVQSNGATVMGFDTLWNYERPSGGALAQTAIAPLMTATRIRLVCLNGEGWLYHDSNQDGVFDKMVGPKPYTGHPAAGELGITGYAQNSAAAVIDNFAYYDAVLTDDGSTTPIIGTNHLMTLTTPATRITPFICAAALSNGTKNGIKGGIPIGGGRWVPLAPDPILNLSLALGGPLGLVGITDAQGVGKPTLNIPNDRALIGLSLVLAGVTLGGPTGFESISNDHRVTIQ